MEPVHRHSQRTHRRRGVRDAKLPRRDLPRGVRLARPPLPLGFRVGARRYGTPVPGADLAQDTRRCGAAERLLTSRRQGGVVLLVLVLVPGGTQPHQHPRVLLRTYAIPAEQNRRRQRGGGRFLCAWLDDCGGMRIREGRTSRSRHDQSAWPVSASKREKSSVHSTGLCAVRVRVRVRVCRAPSNMCGGGRQGRTPIHMSTAPVALGSTLCAATAFPRALSQPVNARPPRSAVKRAAALPVLLKKHGRPEGERDGADG